MKKLLAVGVAMAFGAVAQAETLDVSNFRYTSEITFSGYSGESSLTNFPALVRLSRQTVAGFDGSQVAANGADIRFALADGTLLAHEIDTWDAAGESAIWVKVPEIAGAATSIRLYWGAANPATLPAVDPKAVWTDYVGVWHFSEETGTVADSSLDDGTLDATPKGDPETAGVMSGAIGNARICASTAGQNVHGFVVPSSDALRSLGTTFTFTGWCRNGGASVKSDWMIARFDSGTKVYGWGLRRYGSVNDHTYYVYDSTGNHRSKYPFGASGYGVWDMMTLVIDGTSYISYENGAKPSTNTDVGDTTFPGAVNDIDSPLSFSGAIKNGALDGNAWWGGIDEYRLYKGVRSADFLLAEYLTAAKNATFTTYSAVTVLSDDQVPEVVFDDPVSSKALAKRFTGVVTGVGREAQTVDIYLSYAPQGETLPLATAVVTGLSSGEDFSYALDNLEPGTVYQYNIFAKNDLGAVTETVAGSISQDADAVVATGGAMVIDGGDRIHTFTSDGTLTVTQGGLVEVLLVGGGGGGGAGRGGGGGGGGVIYREAFPLAAGTYDIVVGAGGTGALRDENKALAEASTAGGDTMAFGLTAFGGGAGSSGSSVSGSGASSGGNGGLYSNKGGARTVAGGSVAGQGYRGGNSGVYEGGGGGGAAEPGEGNATGESRRGGLGFLCAISGRPHYYGSGGNGCRSVDSRGAVSGFSVFAAYTVKNCGMSGLDGTGAGGGGGGYQNAAANEFGGNGGSGTVIVRYRAAGDVPYRDNMVKTAGGEIVVYKENGKRYAAHVFREDGVFTLPRRARIQLLAVGGGGGGGGLSGTAQSGGGGGGGVLIISNLVVEAGSYPIHIGAGGIGGTNLTTAVVLRGGSINGGTTTAFGYSVPGGGLGAGSWVVNNSAAGGASGGGALSANSGSAYRENAGVGLSGWGFEGGGGQDSSGGGRCGGGGGAGEPGWDGNGRPGCGNSGEVVSGKSSCGGDGVRCDFIGEEAWYGGGGGGGCAYRNVAPPGGKGGGGNGGSKWSGGNNYFVAKPGEPNTGGGGGGYKGAIPESYGEQCCNGGSGIVVVRYELTPNGLMLLLK